MPSAGQQLLQLRSRLGGGRKGVSGSNNDNVDGAGNAAAAAADDSNGAAALAAVAASAAEVPSCSAAAAAAAAAAAIASSPNAASASASAPASADIVATAAADTADALEEARAASPRKGGSPISPTLLDLSAVFKPSQSLASRRKVARRRHKSGKKGGKGKSSALSATGGGEHPSPTKKGSGRRMRPGRGSQAGPGKEGRLSRRNKRKQQQSNKDGVDNEQQKESSTASLTNRGEASAAAAAAASESIATTAAAAAATTGEHGHAADIFVTKTAGGEAVEAAFLPPPIGLDRNRTYSHSDHDTLLTGSGTLTTAVSTRQATIEGMSHQDTLEHFDVQTNQSSEIASLGGGSTGHAGYGRVGFAQLEELPSVVAGAEDGADAIVADGKTPTLSIHTFPCTRGRSLEAPAPFDERGADAMTRYRQHDEDEYLTDESSEVPVVPLHWPKARRPGEERDFEGLAVVSADADFFDDDDDDDNDELQAKVEALQMNIDDSDIEDEEEDEQDDIPPVQDAKNEEASAKRRLQQQEQEEVTGEEIELEVQESTIGITATAPAASSTSNEKVVVEELSVPATAGMEPTRPTSPPAATVDAASATAVEIAKITVPVSTLNAPEERPPRSASTEPHRASSSTISDTFRRASSVTLPTGTPIGRAAAGKKTPTDHAFSSAVMTPERHRLESNISEHDKVITAVVIGEPDDDDDDFASDRSCNSTVEVLKGDDDVEEEERVEGEEKKEETSSVIAKVPSTDDSESTPSGLVPFSPPLPTRASSFPNLQTARTASFSALPNLPNPIPFVRQAESFGARSNMSIGSNSSSAWKSWPTPVGSTITAVQPAPVQIPSSVLAGNDGEEEKDRKDNLPLFPVDSNAGVCEKEDVDEVPSGDDLQRAAESGRNDDDNGGDDDDDDIEEPERKLRASPDGSASTVRIRTFDASRPANIVEEVVAVEPKSSGGADEDVPSIPAVSSISFTTNRYLNPKLDDGKLYSEHPHDEAPSPLQSPKDDIFRASSGRSTGDEGDENGRSEFPKIAHSSSSGSHSLPAVLSPAYKFEPIENDYYFESESESESCSGEDESKYESSPDGTNSQEGSGDQKPHSIGEQDESNDCRDNDAQSSRYESFARSGVNLMRNLTQNDDSTVSIVAEAAAAATAAVSGRQHQQSSERSSSKENNNKKNDEFTFSLSDIPSMLSRCIGDIGIGEYYDASASAFQPEKEMEKKK